MKMGGLKERGGLFNLEKIPWYETEQTYALYN